MSNVRHSCRSSGTEISCRYDRGHAARVTGPWKPSAQRSLSYGEPVSPAWSLLTSVSSTATSLPPPNDTGASNDSRPRCSKIAQIRRSSGEIESAYIASRKGTLGAGSCGFPPCRASPRQVSALLAAYQAVQIMIADVTLASADAPAPPLAPVNLRPGCPGRKWAGTTADLGWIGRATFDPAPAHPTHARRPPASAKPRVVFRPQQPPRMSDSCYDTACLTSEVVAMMPVPSWHYAGRGRNTTLRCSNQAHPRQIEPRDVLTRIMSLCKM
jgi:hypothetical protein